MNVFKHLPRTFTGRVLGALAIACAVAATGFPMQISAQPLDPPLCERTAELQAVILELTSADDHCGEFPANVVRELTNLQANGKGIISLKEGDFEDFDALTELNLSGNSLRWLPANVFRGLGNLVKINLQDNPLLRLSRNAFLHLDKLEDLNLWNNELTTLPGGPTLFGASADRGGAFRDLGKLTTLNLGANHLESFPVDAFYGLRELEALHMRENALQTLPENVSNLTWLDELDSLEVLNLSGNLLQKLDESPFEPVGDTLTQLLLHNNRLTWLPRGMFEDLELTNSKSGISVQGALRLEGNQQGDGQPSGDNPDGRETTPNEDDFTLPLYPWTILKDRSAGGLNLRQFVPFELYMPHAAPFRINFDWYRITNARTQDLGTRAATISAGRFLSTGQAEIHWETNKTIDIDFNANPRALGGGSNSLQTGGGGGNTGCGFDPCYDGFGFETYGVARSGGLDAAGESAPEITGATFISAPASSDGYVAGEDVVVEVAFRYGPLVEFVPPTLKLRIGGQNRDANWEPTSIASLKRNTGHALRFRYQIQEDDRDSDGIEIRYLTGNSDIKNVYQNSGQFGSQKDFNLASNGAHKVQNKVYVWFTSSEPHALKEGESVDLRFRVTDFTEATPNLFNPNVTYRIRRRGDTDRGATWNNYGNSHHWVDSGTIRPISGFSGNRDGGTFKMPDGVRTGIIRIRIDAGGAYNEAAEPASRENIEVEIVATDDYDVGRISSVRIWIKEGVCDRSPGIRGALIAVGEHGDCGDVTSDDLTSIGEMNLSGRNIANLMSGDFLELDRVTVLDLRNNRLSAWPQGVFDEVTDTLTVLKLQNNQFQTIPEGLFAGLSNFESIFLDGNPGNSDGADFPLWLRIEHVGGAFDSTRNLTTGDQVDFKLTLLEGAPWPFTVDLPAPSSGSLNVNSVSFAAGDVESEILTFTASADTDRIEVSPRNPSDPPDDCAVTNAQGDCFSGLEIRLPEKLVLEGPPVNSSVRITSVPAMIDTYNPRNPADLIVVSVNFNEEIEVTAAEDGSLPTLTLEVGEATKTTRIMVYDPALSGPDRLAFRYKPQENIDEDTDGISIPPGALALNGARIADLLNIPAASESITNLPGLPDDPAHKISRGGPFPDATPPTISSVRITSVPVEGDVYTSANPEDLIELTLDFSEEVAVTLHQDGRLPTLTLQIGKTARSAVYNFTSLSTNRLTFSYRPQASDEDLDGISIPPAAFTLNGVRITDLVGNPFAPVSVNDLPALPDDPDHKVGFIPPVITGVRIISTPQEGDAYTADNPEDLIVVSLDFDEEIRIVNAADVRMPTSVLPSGSSPTLVLPDDSSPTAMLPDDSSPTAMLPGDSSPTTMLPGDSSPTAMLPGDSSPTTMLPGDSSPTAMLPDGDPPTLVLRIGETTRVMVYDPALSTTDRLAFRYKPQDSDEDTDGISVPVGALTLNGSHIVDLLNTPLASTSVDNSPGLPDDPAHKVRLGTPPIITGVRITSAPVEGNVYTSNNPGDRIVVSLNFDEQVVVTPGANASSPTLSLQIGKTLRVMIYDPVLSTTDRLAFGYRPQDTDEDLDGVSVPAGALALNGARIADLTDNPVASGQPAGLPDDPDHKVGYIPPVITGMRITSVPQKGVTYIPDNPEDIIVVSLDFDEQVVVTPGANASSPTLALQIGATRRTMVYNPALSTTNRLAFRYKPQNTDEDTDGVSVPAGALSLNGARIADLLDTPLAPESVDNLPGLPDDPGHKVGLNDVLLRVRAFLEGALQ